MRPRLRYLQRSFCPTSLSSGPAGLLASFVVVFCVVCLGMVVSDLVDDPPCAAFMRDGLVDCRPWVLDMGFLFGVEAGMILVVVMVETGRSRSSLYKASRHHDQNMIS